MHTEINKFLDITLNDVLPEDYWEDPFDLYDPYGRLIVNAQRFSGDTFGPERHQQIRDVLYIGYIEPSETVEHDYEPSYGNSDEYAEYIREGVFCNLYQKIFDTDDFELPPAHYGSIILFWAACESMRFGTFKYQYGTLAFQKVNKLNVYTPSISVWPKATITVLAEPGVKSRGLTKNMVWLTIILQTMRQIIEPMFKKHPKARSGITETHKFWSYFKRRKEHKFPKSAILASCDYTAATDTIPLKVIEALWLGFCEGLGMPKLHPFRLYMPLLWSQRELVPSNDYDSLFKSHGFDSYVNHMTGSFMGEPVSFMTLTLANLVVLEITDFYEAKGFSPDFSLAPDNDWDNYVGIIDNDAMIVGDDLFTIRYDLWVITGILRPAQALLGFQRSVGKDYLSLDLATLAEDNIYLDPITSIIDFLDKIKIRLLSPMTRSFTDRRQSILGKGSQVSVVIDYISQSDKHLSNTISKIFVSTFEEILETQVFVQLPIELPPSCGGLSLPIRLWEDFEPLFRRELRWLRVIMDMPPLESLVYRIQLRRLNEADWKGLGLLESNKIISYLLTVLDIPSDHGEFGGIMTYKDILANLEAIGEFDPKDPIFIGYSAIVEKARKHLDLITMDEAVDNIDRCMNTVFAFNNPGVAKVKKISFSLYQRRCHRYWQRVFKKHSAKINAVSNHGFKSFRNVGLAMQYGTAVYISKISRLYRFGTGWGSLFFDLGPSSVQHELDTSTYFGDELYEMYDRCL